MNNFLRILVLVSIPLLSKAQFSYTFVTTPVSAEVYVNGIKKYTTPCKVKFFWHNKVNGKIIFAVSAPGYKTWTDTISKKPLHLVYEKDIQLERDYPSFQLDSNQVAVGFDKLLADFKDGSVVGNVYNRDGTMDQIKWDGNVKIGSADFERTFYETISKSGFKTPFSVNNKLFSDDEDHETELPRYVVGVRLVDYSVKVSPDKHKSYGVRKRKGATYMKLKWQILDKKTDKVVSTYVTQDTSNYTMSFYSNYVDNSQAFTDGLIDFINNSNLYQLVKNAKQINSYEVASQDSSKVQYIIPKPDIPTFTTRSDMIQFAQPACVTIITDGGSGSGVIINAKGYVLSAYHVVDGVNKIQVQFSSGIKLDAKVLAYDKPNDVVLLDINGSGFHALPVDTLDDTKLGAEVVTIGTPAEIDLGQSVASGILSGKRMMDKKVYLQADIAVSPGNSGGPLLNSEGQIIGIVQSKIIGKGVEGIGFAIPVDRAMKALGIQEK